MASRSGLQVLLWASGLAIALSLLAAQDRIGVLTGPTLVDSPQSSVSLPTEAIVLAAILLVALLLRVPHLASFPPRLHNDEMSCGLAAREFLASPAPSVFSLGWYSCPRFGFFLTSLGLRFFGDSLFGLRMSSVVLGMVSLLGIHLLGRLLFGVGAGLLATLFAATFHWHVHLSRTGFHYVQGMAFAVWAVYLLALGFATRRRLAFGLAGVVTGLGLQTYFSVRLVPFLLVAWTLALVLEHSMRNRREGALADGRPGSGARVAAVGLSITGVLAVAAVAPLLAPYRDHPEDFNSRTEQVFIFSEAVATHMKVAIRGEGGGGPDPTTAELLAFGARRVFGLPFRGRDSSEQYGFQWPFIPWSFWIVFAASLAFALRQARRPGFSLLWLVTIGTAVAGGVLTVDPPFTPRLSALAAFLPLFPAAFFAAIPACPAVRRSRPRRVVAATLSSLFVLFWVVQNVDLYFRKYPGEFGGSRRDWIVRRLLERPKVDGVVNLFPEPEAFGHESYRFVGRELKVFNLGTSHRSVQGSGGEGEAVPQGPSPGPDIPLPSLGDVLGEAASAGRSVLVIAPTSLVADGDVEPLRVQDFHTSNDPSFPGDFSWAVVAPGPG